MRFRFPMSVIEVRETALALLVGVAGAALAWALSFPLHVLTGPAIAVSLLSLLGFTLRIATPVRDAAFVFVGIGIGAGVDPAAADAILRWPVAFVALGVMLILAMYSCREILSRGFDFTPRSAVLAAAPGHLSFVLAMAASAGGDIMRVTVAQSVRLLSLTLVVPVVAVAMGLDLGTPIMSTAPGELELASLAALVVLALIAAAILKRLNVPAPLLIGALVVSASGHLSDVTPGALHPYVTSGCLIVMGTLIGSRFTGVTFRQLRQVAAAGLTATAVTVVLAVLAAIPVSYVLEMPAPHVLVAFAPGGLETMIVMGAVLGANPGFVAAAHVARLLMLSALIPLFVTRSSPDQRH